MRVQANYEQHDTIFSKEEDPEKNGVHTVFPGVTLRYSDLQDKRYITEEIPPGNFIEICHCKEGRQQQERSGNLFYLLPGDLYIAKITEKIRSIVYPQKRYKGISIMIDIDKAPQCFSCILGDVNVQPAVLAQRLCDDNQCFIIRSKPYIEHIFSELYHIPEPIRKGYFKIKIMELLLMLSCVSPEENEILGHTVPCAQIELAKKASAYLGEHMDQHITIAETAAMFHVSESTLKTAFKNVYGEPIYTHIRHQKMKSAAAKLRNSDTPILHIAGECGYDNGSKFGRAFREIMGMTPREYRKHHRND